MHHEGSLTVTKANASSLSHITSVGGSLNVEAEVDFPQLASVGGYLYVGAEVDFPLLTGVGGNLYVRAEAALPDTSGITFGAGQVLALWGYALHFKDGLYRAGCRGPWTAEQALAHWTEEHPEPLRASLFRQVILENEGM
jgi:hypothetical protein